MYQGNIIFAAKEPDESYYLFAAESLSKRLKAILDEIEGVCRAEDIEYVHRMRVASRRMRSAIRNFQECFPNRNIKNWNKQIRSVTRSLGRARDMDVQIEFLQNFLNELTEPHYRTGIRRILLRLCQQRERLQPEIVKVMGNLKGSGILKEMENFCHQIRAVASLHNVKKNSSQVFERSFLAISSQLRDFLFYEQYVNQPDSINELHAMRIAAKRLRYTTEIFSELYVNELEEHIEIMKKIQTMLGDINDCAVWIIYSEQFLRDERERTLEYFGNILSFGRIKSGIIFLQKDRENYRRLYYNEFLKFWQDIQKQHYWEKFQEKILDPCLGN